ncbi:MAPEG family protein [Microbulbifer magnicolonia]|uniref:MAPEG family protein n=1 Tax=Microbulbifer magnicolonia TaxID=3109744 RepID=UPI002B400C10|nr:MAPEG family protein [Microbulbifer sp. GG15]
MAVAFWCLLAAVLMPPIFAAIAKATGEGRYNNLAPREYLERQTGLSRRADWAQRNSFEALPTFAAAVLAAALAGAPEIWLSGLSLAFVAARILYGISYLKDWGYARSLFWFSGFFCCLGLLVLAALGAAA